MIYMGSRKIRRQTIRARKLGKSADGLKVLETTNSTLFGVFSEIGSKSRHGSMIFIVKCRVCLFTYLLDLYICLPSR